MPPSGYSGETPRPGVLASADPDAPALTRIPDASLADLFQIDPGYRRAHAVGAVKVVGAFAVADRPGVRLTGVWAVGFLPVTLAFSDGRCFSLAADYIGGALSRGRLTRASCERKAPGPGPTSPPQPPNDAIRWIGSSWGYSAYADGRTKRTVVTAPFRKTYEPLFTTPLAVSAIMAMNGVDFPGGNVTLVAPSVGRTLVVTLEVTY